MAHKIWFPPPDLMSLQQCEISQQPLVSFDFANTNVQLDVWPVYLATPVAPSDCIWWNVANKPLVDVNTANHRPTLHQDHLDEKEFWADAPGFCVNLCLTSSQRFLDFHLSFITGSWAQYK